MYCFNPLIRILVILVRIFALHAYVLSNNYTSWNNINCANDVIATPDLQLYDVILGDNTYRINNEDLHLTPDMTSAWVGYYQIPVGFEYIGCAMTIDVKSTTSVTMQPINGDPGHCFIGCVDLSIVGVNNDMCYCLHKELDENIATNSDKCTHHCSAVPDVACGSSDGDHLSIYRRNENVTKVTRYSGAVDRSTKICLGAGQWTNYEWKNCTIPFAVMCLAGDNVIQLKLKTGPRYLPWIDAGYECIKSHYQPFRYVDNLNVEQVVQDLGYSGGFWTGVFRTNATFKLSETTPDWINFTSPDLRYGVLECNTTGGYHYLHFVKRGADLRKALCNRDYEAATSEHTKDKPAANDNTLMIVMIAGGGSFVAIVIIVVTIIFLKRKPCRPTTNEQRRGNQDHAYFAVEPHSREPSAGNTSDVVYDYVDVELLSNPQIGKQPDALPNTYLHAVSRDVSQADHTYDSTYDPTITSQNAVSRDVNQADDTYDSTYDPTITSQNGRQQSGAEMSLMTVL